MIKLKKKKKNNPQKNLSSRKEVAVTVILTRNKIIMIQVKLMIMEMQMKIIASYHRLKVQLLCIQVKEVKNQMLINNLKKSQLCLKSLAELI